MALADPDNETAMGTQVLGPEKSRVLSILGPGLITGASDDDPSGIATYSQVCAQFGFSISWTMLFSYPLMAAIQEISGRIGRTTFHVLDFLRGLPEEQIRANCGPKNGDHGRPECRTCGKRGYEKTTRHFPLRNMHDHDGAKIGKQAERQPLKNRNVALIRNKDLEHHAQNAGEHDI